jgi:hypothetical protein
MRDFRRHKFLSFLAMNNFEQPKPSVSFEEGEQVRVSDGPFASFRALPEKKESGGIPLRARIGFKNRTGRQASMRWGSRIQRICVSG